MVDAVTAIGIVGMIATALMIVGMLYLTFLGIRSERQYRGSEPEADTESEPEADTESEPDSTTIESE